MVATILLADDHPMFRQGLRKLVESEHFEVIGETGNGLGAIEIFRQKQPDVAVLDFSMPTLNGIEAAKRILEDKPRARVILLTIHEDDAFVVQALDAGIRGYVLKEQAVTDLAAAIRKVLRPGIYLSKGLSRDAVEAWRRGKANPAEPLTGREREVMCLISEGKTTREIAELLGISVKTADSHRTHLMQKLGIHETASLVRYAIRHGFIDA